ncbi:hemin ABC transporter substrate-binding protein [Elioraea sp.]|uniref:heme/hemin ABC transporter substrate-binding protein n=1 Tax=Elioraea sp. TaxID=2185103 RepID=UPI0021DC4501|nr:ABC transporter substrate-binding protein [Elioraea sp.]GIX09252.1 MAG: hemin ABC transporter substrate-binding protein [Elioraea sp.]
MLTRRALALAPLAAAMPARAGEPRLVVAGGGIAEIICALGARTRIAGVDSTVLFPTALRRLPQIGYLRSLSAEGVLSLRPDLLVAAHEAGPPEVLDQLERAGVRMVRVGRIHDPVSLVAAIRMVAAALDRSAEGERLAAALTADFAALARFAADPPHRPRVVFVLAIGGGAPQAAGRETAADAMLALAGAENVVTDYRGYRPVSAESLLAASPEAVVTTSHTVAALGGVEGIAAIPALAVLPAVRRRRIVALDSLYLLGFGPRTAHAARDLAAALHEAARVPALPHRAWLDDVA